MRKDKGQGLDKKANNLNIVRNKGQNSQNIYQK